MNTEIILNNRLDEATKKSNLNLSQNELIRTIQTRGMDRELWNELVFSAASNHGDNILTFHTQLKEDLDTIGLDWSTLITDMIKADVNFSGSGSAYESRQMELLLGTAIAEGFYYTAYLTFRE